MKMKQTQRFEKILLLIVPNKKMEENLEIVAKIAKNPHFPAL